MDRFLFLYFLKCTTLSVKEIFPLTNEMPPHGFILKKKLLIEIYETHRFIKEKQSKQSVLLNKRAKLNTK